MFYTWISCKKNWSPSQSYKTTTNQHSSFDKANPNIKPNPSTRKFIEGTRVVIPCIKSFSEQYRHTLTKYKVRVFLKDASTIKSLLMHPKDPIWDAQKTYIIYYYKCQAYNCIDENIGETKRYLKEKVSNHRNQTISAIRNHHISTNHPKAELNDFMIIDRDSNPLHHWTKEAHHIQIKDPSLNRNIGKVKTPSVFNKLLKPHTQLEQPQSSIPHPRGAPSSLGLSTQKTTLPTFLISVYSRSVIPMFTPFKLQDNWMFRYLPSKKYNRKTVFTPHKVSSSPKKNLSFNFSGLLISSSTRTEEGTR